MANEKLPFFTYHQDGRIIETWCVRCSGDYSKDCATGRDYFRMLMLQINLTGNSVLLTRVLRDQAAFGLGNWSGIETGFHQAMADEIMAQA